MELDGRVISVLELQTGNSPKGEWRKQNFVIETLSDYPKKICVSVWGDKTAVLNTLKSGEIVSLSIDIESREFNGKWYTDVKAFRVDRRVDALSNNDAPPMPSQDDFDSLYSSEDDLVF